MSTEEDTELCDLLQQTLENNGSLAKIRAQLRACVYMAFDEDEKVQAKAPLLNHKIKKHLDKPEGKLLFALVHEFLEYFNMDCTLSVYKAESYLDNGYAYTGRAKLLNQLHLEENDSIPVLLQLVQQFTSNISNINGLNINNTMEETSSNGPILNQTFDIPAIDIGSKNTTPRSAVSDVNNDTYEGTSSIAEDSVNALEKSTISTESSQHLAEEKLTEMTNGDLSYNKPCLDRFENLSLSDTSMQKSESYKNKSPRSPAPEPLQANSAHNELVMPTFYNSTQSDNLDSYEEDFMSASVPDGNEEEIEAVGVKLTEKTETMGKLDNLSDHSNSPTTTEDMPSMDDLLKSH